METNKDLIPCMAVPPIEIVKDEIKARGYSQKEFARMLGMQPSNLSRMFREGAPITCAFALKLEDALGIDAEMWCRLQVRYERNVRKIQQREESRRIGENETGHVGNATVIPLRQVL